MDPFNYREQRRRDPESSYSNFLGAPPTNLSPLTIPTQSSTYSSMHANGYNHSPINYSPVDYSPVDYHSRARYPMSPSMSPTSPADYWSPVTPSDFLNATFSAPSVVTDSSPIQTYGHHSGYPGEASAALYGSYDMGYSATQPPQKPIESEGHISSHERAPSSSIPCQWNMCGQYIAVDQNALCAHLREHLALESPLPTRERVCRWAGCICAAKTDKSGRCNNQPMGQHPTHVQYVEQHVWDVHFGLRWFCNRCFQADFTTKRSMERHQKQGCSAAPAMAVLPLICAACTLQMQSQPEMDVHARVCPGRP